MRFNFLLFIGFFLASFILPQAVVGQEGFSARALVGFNASQIRGDELAGYDKVGLAVGVQMSYPLKEKLDLGIEMLFSQKGSQAKIGFGAPIDVQRTTLNYIEIPVIVKIKDWYIEEDNYYRVKGQVGLSYGRLFDVSSSNGLYEDDLGNFKNNDLAILAGVEYSINRKLAVVARYSNSFVKIYKNEKLKTEGLINYLWNFSLSYKL